METTVIQNMNELRSAVVKLTANVNNMCNTTTTEDVIDAFIAAKDLLVAVYKFNVERVNK